MLLWCVTKLLKIKKNSYRSGGQHFIQTENVWPEKYAYLTKFDFSPLRIVKNMNVTYNKAVSLSWLIRAGELKKKKVCKHPYNCPIYDDVPKIYQITIIKIQYSELHLRNAKKKLCQKMTPVRLTLKIKS